MLFDSENQNNVSKSHNWRSTVTKSNGPGRRRCKLRDTVILACWDRVFAMSLYGGLPEPVHANAPGMSVGCAPRLAPVSVRVPRASVAAPTPAPPTVSAVVTVPERYDPRVPNSYAAARASRKRERADFEPVSVTPLAQAAGATGGGAKGAVAGMMARMGYVPGKGLGADGQGRLSPVRAGHVRGRAGLGHPDSAQTGSGETAD